MQRIRLDQHTLELQGAEQGFECRALVGFAWQLRDKNKRLAALNSRMDALLRNANPELG